MKQLLKALVTLGLPKPFTLPMTFINVVKIHLRREDKWKDELLAFVIDFIVLTLKHTIQKTNSSRTIALSAPLLF